MNKQKTYLEDIGINFCPQCNHELEYDAVCPNCFFDLEVKEKTYLELCAERGWNPSLEEATEYCPHCESEVTVPFYCEDPNFKSKCPNCGKRLMICSECINTYGCDWDDPKYGKKGCCKFNKGGN